MSFSRLRKGQDVYGQFRRWPKAERAAVRYVRGRVIDKGEHVYVGVLERVR